MHKLLLISWFMVFSIAGFAQVEKVRLGTLPADQAFGFSMSPDKQAGYFVRSFSGRDTLIIYEMRKKGGAWQEPKSASFSGRAGGWKDIDPFITPDGKRLFFQSNRPLRKGEPAKKDFDIWVMDRKNTGWSEPQHLGLIVNSDTSDSFLSATASGKLYFGSMRNGTLGGMDIFSAEPEGSSWSKPQNIGSTINSPEHDTNPFIAPDESFLIMTKRAHREKKDSELHISFNLNGKWSTPWNLGAVINSEYSEFCPFMIPGEDTLYFARLDKGVRFRENIYKTHFSPNKLKKLVDVSIEVVAEAIARSVNYSDTVFLHDSSYKIFAAETSEGFGRTDLFISNNNNGKWSTPFNLGPIINSAGDEFAPGVSDDKRFLFFKRRSLDQYSGVQNEKVLRVDLKDVLSE